MEHMYLVGAEQVQNAGHAMTSAAQEMKQAANNLDSSLDMFLRRFEELVQRLEALKSSD